MNAYWWNKGHHNWWCCADRPTLQNRHQRQQEVKTALVRIAYSIAFTATLLTVMMIADTLGQ